MQNQMSRSISPVSVIIPAAGQSLRFRREAPANANRRHKLYTELNGKPLLAYSISAFDQPGFVREIIIPCERGGESRFRKQVLNSCRFRTPVMLVTGGKTRAESVWNGLKRVSPASRYVCIHDGARPLVQAEWLGEMMRRLNGCDGIVAGRGVIPTVKQIDPEKDVVRDTLDRRQLFEAETPQLILKKSLLAAYRRLGKTAFHATDDASLIEQTGGRIKVYSLKEPNIKVTTYQDLSLVRALVSSETTVKFGIGSDRHRLVSGRAFYLGGVRIPSAVGPLGHSDGDPLLHAVADGILGAIGAGDIGDYFSDRNPKWKNAKSSHFLKQVLQMAREKGFAPAQIDSTVILEKPRLGSWKRKIRLRLAELLSLAPEEVNVKAKTAEGLGVEGEGKAVSAQALVVLKKVS